MMGMPSLKRNGKMFGGYYGDGLVVKLGRVRVDELIASGRGQAFDPSGAGRPMKDWALVGLPSTDWDALAAEARDRLDGSW